MNLFIINFKKLMVKYSFYLIIFIVAGEIITRLDRAFNLSYRKSMLPNNQKIQKAFDLDSFPQNYKISKDQYRVLVIGDSYIKGIGINTNQQFSNIFLDSLKKIMPSPYKPDVLNLSQSGNTFIENYALFNNYSQKFKPNTILWFHNLSDLNLFFNEASIDYQTKTVVFNDKDLANRDYNKFILENHRIKNVNNITPNEKITNYHRGLIGSLKSMLKNSELIKFSKYNFYNELLNLGIRIPSTEFNYLTKYAYLKGSLELELFNELFNGLFNGLIQNSKDNKTNFIFYLLPEFNLIHKSEFFHNFEESLKLNFKDQKQITYVNGRTNFLNYSPSQLTLVSTDSHPNELAHQLISNHIIELLLKNIFKYSG